MSLQLRRIAIWSAGLTAFLFGFATTLRSSEPMDEKLRADFIAGLAANDKAALDRAMKAAETRLAADPKDASTLVWHGAALYFRAGQSFTGGDMETAMQLVQKGGAEMGRAVELEPDNIEVRSVRGATLLEATKYMEGNPEAPELLNSGLKDYEHALDLHRPNWDALPEQVRGDLLSRLAEGWERAGDVKKARLYHERAASEMKGSAVGKRSAEWLAAHPAK